MIKTYSGKISKLKENQYFVFGANTQFRHGRGSALYALKFGAVYGKGGIQGQTYAIITKDLTKKIHPSISKEKIIYQIKELYKYAEFMENKEFLIAYSNSPNLNGYTPNEMANMFSSFEIPNNIIFEENFAKLLK